ncbi:hypothetical protein D3C78_1495340 [compost metagenome]
MLFLRLAGAGLLRGLEQALAGIAQAVQVAGIEDAQGVRTGALDAPAELFLAEEAVEQHQIRLQLADEGVEAVAVEGDRHFRHVERGQVGAMLGQRSGAGESHRPALGAQQLDQFDHPAARRGRARFRPDIADDQYLHDEFPCALRARL